MRLADADNRDRYPPGSQMGPRGGEPIIVPFRKLAFKPKWLAEMGGNDGERRFFAALRMTLSETAG